MRTFILSSFFFFSSLIFSQTISWQQLSGPHGGAIYSIVRDNSGNVYANTIGNPGPFKSTDDGESWFSIMNGLTPGDNGGFHPMNINSNGDLFIGGAHNAGGLCRSTDGGNSWEYLNNLNPGSSIICISFDNSNNVYVGTGTGIYRSTDDGENWTLYGMSGSGVESIAFNDSGHMFLQVIQVQFIVLQMMVPTGHNFQPEAEQERFQWHPMDTSLQAAGRMQVFCDLQITEIAGHIHIHKLFK